MRIYCLMIVFVLLSSFSVLSWAAPTEVTIQGSLSNADGPLTGNRVCQLQFYDAATGGNALGSVLTGICTVSSTGRWAITLNPPAAVLDAAGNVWYELAIDSAATPDGTIDTDDVFSERVRVSSVLFARRADDADTLDGMDSTNFATTTSLSNGLAAKADTGHSHSFAEITGTATDAQIPDTITIDQAAQATTATYAANADTLDGMDSTNFATTTSLSNGLAAKADTGHSHGFAEITGTATDAQVSDALTISGGSVDNSPIGATTPSTGTFTQATATTATLSALNVSGSATLSGNVTANTFYGDGSNLTGLTDADFKADGSVAMTGDLNMGGNAIVNLGTDLADGEVADNLTISGGAIDNTTIGGTTPAAGAFTTVDTGQGANELYAMDQDVRNEDSVAFASASLGAPESLDQEQTGSSENFGYFNPGNTAAQVFTAGSSGLLSTLKLHLGSSSPSDIDVSIYSGVTPGTGSLLSSVERVSVTHGDFSRDEVTINFSSPAAVTATQQYYIRIDSVDGSIMLSGWGDIYADGNAWADFGSGWTERTDVDIYFRTYVLSTGDALSVSGAAQIQDILNPPNDTTDRLYNNGGNLFWNGASLGGLAPSAAQYVFAEVADGNTDAENGTALQDALTAARALSPSATNRVAVIVPPGRYNVGSTPLALDTAYMDLVGLTTNREAQYIYGASFSNGDGVIKQTVDHVRIENLKVEITDGSGSVAASDPTAYFADVSWDSGTKIGSSPNTVVKNCEFIGDESNNSWSMRLQTHYAGTYEDCTAGKYAFGTTGGDASGTFINCTAGDFSFGSGSDATGTFIDCTAGTYSFAGTVSSGGEASGTFTRCTAGEQSFANEGTASGNFTDCTAGNYSFGGSGTASGTFTRCTGEDYCFGDDLASGKFYDCTAEYMCFGGYGDEASGEFHNCTGGQYAFTNGPGGTASGQFYNCIGGDDSFGGGGGTASGDFYDCTGDFDAFGGDGGTAEGTFKNCIGDNDSFGGYGGTASGDFYHCTGGNTAFGGHGGTASGNFYGCTAGDDSFGGFNGTSSGVFHNCTGENTAFGGGAGGTASGEYYNCKGDVQSFGGDGGTASGTFSNCSGGDNAFGGNGGFADGGVFRHCTGGSGAFIETGTPSPMHLFCIEDGAQYTGND